MQSQKTQFEIDISGADPDQFEKDRDSFAGLVHSFGMGKTLTEDATEVLVRLKESLAFADKGYRFFAAKAGKDVVGLMIMAKATDEEKSWWVFDLLSVQKGAGTALASAGVHMALTDAPGKPVRLLSLNETSTAFWEKLGFKRVSSSNTTMTKSVPMVFDPKG